MAWMDATSSLSPRPIPTSTSRAYWASPPPLVIVGVKGRHQEELEAELAARKGPGRVILTGWVDAPSLSALYHAAHLFVFPSKYEGFGLPPLEAMSVGVPVVSSNATSLAEIVGEAGLTFDPADEPAMARWMRRAWDDEELRREMVARGYAQAAKFTWRRAAEQTLQSYRLAQETRRGKLALLFDKLSAGG
jgi:glycosyltransferase involved in cell wall biosynthesis